ncbi:MAG: hypothetical protein JWM68_1573 [Verrucomicrobiales bacterium]|nr:hypothetical protein [Verrucomicrobiales bacterium]
MKQQFVKTIPRLIHSAVQAIHGSAKAGDTIGLFHGSAPKFTADLQALIGARDAYEVARLPLRRYRDELQEKTKECREAIRLTRDVLKQYFGIEYSRVWDITGMVGSLGLPKVPEELLPLCKGFKAYLGAHPAHENPMLNITAAQMEILYEELSNAINAVMAQEVVITQLLQTRNEKMDRLYKRLRICVDELELLIDPLDTRWSLFGFNKPGADETPDAPEKIEVVMLNDTTAMMELPPTPRTDYYRFYKRVVGVDVEPVAVGSRSEPAFTLEDLPRNSTIEFSASAVNSGGESRRSASVTIVTH